jgi:hypothetical protein
LETDRLVLHAMEAREHQEVSVVVEPEDRAVDRPLGSQLGRVRVVVPGGSAA